MGNFPFFRCSFAVKCILLILSKNPSNNVQLKRNFLPETYVIHKARKSFTDTYLTDIKEKKTLITVEPLLFSLCSEPKIYYTVNCYHWCMQGVGFG